MILRVILDEMCDITKDTGLKGHGFLPFSIWMMFFFFLRSEMHDTKFSCLLELFIFVPDLGLSFSLDKCVDLLL